MTEHDHSGIMAWGWTCTGMRGMALGHLKPTPQNTHKFEERNTQVFPLVVKPDTNDLSPLTDREICEEFARRFAERNPATELIIHEDEVILSDDRFGLGFLFGADGRLAHKSDLRIGRHTHD
jgi:hypothetical protein